MQVALVDTQPGRTNNSLPAGVTPAVVIDHHPEQPGYSAVFKDIRADYGSTSTILTEHLRAVDVNISERTDLFITACTSSGVGQMSFR